MMLCIPCDKSRKIVLCSFIFFVVCFFAGTANSAVFNVGSTRQYTMPSQVASLVSDGDTVEIDAGVYDDCTTWNANNLLLEGIGDGYAHCENNVCGEKGIWVIYGDNTTIANMEFSGAAISASEGENGAGIRAQGGSFTIRRCYFHDNQDGILSDPAHTGSSVLIEYSVFAYNGAGDGYSHNLYIGNNISAGDSIRYDSLVFRYNFTHGAKVGNNLKSRANRNYILYNRIMDDSDGTASWDIDLPNGGLAVIMGNEIEKGPNAQNSNTMECGLEGVINTPPHTLCIVNNTFVNDVGRGTFINLPSTGVDSVLIMNNIFAGSSSLISSSPAVIDSAANIVSPTISSVGLTDPAEYNYQLTATSPARAKGVTIDADDGVSLTPIYEYADTANMRARPMQTALDIGAYQYAAPQGIPELYGVYENHAGNGLQYEIALNPIRHELDFSVGNDYIRILKIDAFDQLGRQLETRFQEINPGKFSLKTSNIPAGVYIIRAYTTAGLALGKALVLK